MPAFRTCGEAIARSRTVPLLLPSALLAFVQALVLALGSLGGGYDTGATGPQTQAAQAIAASRVAAVQAEHRSHEPRKNDFDGGSGSTALPAPEFALSVPDAADTLPAFHTVEAQGSARRGRAHPPTGPPLT